LTLQTPAAQLKLAQICFKNNNTAFTRRIFFLCKNNMGPFMNRKRSMHSYGDAVRHAAARDPRRRAGRQQLVRQHAGAAPVLPALVRVPRLDGLLGAAHVGLEHGVRRHGGRVARPRLVAPLAEVLLVGRVRRQRVHHRHELGGLQHPGHRVQEEPVRVRQERRVLGRVALRVRQQPTHQRRAVRHVPAQRVLPEVERRVLRRREPDERRQDGREVRRRGERGPPGRVPDVGVPDVDRLVVPPLELVVGLNGAGVRVVELHVRLHPVANGRPQQEPVVRVRVVLDEEPDAVRLRRILHSHSPDQEMTKHGEQINVSGHDS